MEGCLENTVAISSSYGLSRGSHGGQRRTAQLVESLENEGYRVVLASSGDKSCNISRIRALCAGIFVWIKTGKAKVRISRILYLGARIGWFCIRLRRMKPALIIIENHHEYVTILASELGNIPLIICPQNLESLCRDDDVAGNGFPKTLKTELSILKRGRLVFTISREEQCFLRLALVDAYFASYIPTRFVRSRLKYVRRRRKITSKSRILILGSAFNPFTLEGMQEVVQWLSLCPREDLNITVAGLGISGECFNVNDVRFKFLGSVEDQELESLLATCVVMIVHQKRGGGALTRIAEALYAEIPVLANDIAARSYFETNIHTYAVPEDLHKILNRFLPEKTVWR